MSLTSQICEILKVDLTPLKLAQLAVFWKPSPSENSEPPENCSFLLLEISQRECDLLARTTLTWMASVGLAVKPADRPGFPESRRSDSSWDTQRDSGLAPIRHCEVAWAELFVTCPDPKCVLPAGKNESRDSTFSGFYEPIVQLPGSQSIVLINGQQSIKSIVLINTQRSITSNQSF
jgi:hypothetical protein